MTTHELARKLLEGPDVAVVVEEAWGGFESVDVLATSPVALRAAYGGPDYPVGTVILI